MEPTSQKGYVLMIKKVLAIGALGSIGFLGMTAIPAGAATNIGPNVNLKDKAGVIKFAPKTLNLTLSKGKKCKSTNFAFSITNKSGATQNIDFDGNPFFTSAPGQVNDICVGVGTSTYSAEGTGATLTINMAPRK
jgi:hypothetical protein